MQFDRNKSFKDYLDKFLIIVYGIPMNGQLLKKYLDMNEIKPAEFARKLNVTERSVYNYINGKLPSRKIEKKIKRLTSGIVTFS